MRMARRERVEAGTITLGLARAERAEEARVTFPDGEQGLRGLGMVREMEAEEAMEMGRTTILMATPPPQAGSTEVELRAFVTEEEVKDTGEPGGVALSMTAVSVFSMVAS